jgi:hypothetical protein
MENSRAAVGGILFYDDTENGNLIFFLGFFFDFHFILKRKREISAYAQPTNLLNMTSAKNTTAGV